jgi:hypothetical protein
MPAAGLTFMGEAGDCWLSRDDDNQHDVAATFVHGDGAASRSDCVTARAGPRRALPERRHERWTP